MFVVVKVLNKSHHRAGGKKKGEFRNSDSCRELVSMFRISARCACAIVVQRVEKKEKESQ